MLPCWMKFLDMERSAKRNLSRLGKAMDSCDKRGQLGKRKRSAVSLSKKAKRVKSSHIEPRLVKDEGEVEKLTTNILGADQQYNDIIILLKNAKINMEFAHECCSALCRVFSSLILQGRLRDRPNVSKNEAAIALWLESRYEEYKMILYQGLLEGGVRVCEVYMSVAMQLAQIELDTDPNGSLFPRLICIIIEQISEDAFDCFLEIIDELPQHTRLLCTKCLSFFLRSKDYLDVRGIDRVLMLLSRMSVSTLQAGRAMEPYADAIDGLARRRHTSTDEMSRCWLDLLQKPLTQEQRRQVLELIPGQIAPLVSRKELLLDFLADCCERGGTEALASLSGLRSLISEYGLDYPLLYARLYSAVGTETLHKRYRSQTIRLLDYFLSSTHLPASIVASFIKRLARLCLYGPPSAAVAVLPFLYNIIQTHRACSVMLHRAQSPLRQTSPQQEKFEDSFDATETDPSQTGAIDSSLWELRCLTFHWHPNAATISRIIAEQFLKHSYSLEHFLDHSYDTILSAEMKKTVIKEPAVEYHISRTILGDGQDWWAPSRLWTFHKIKNH